MKEGKITMVKHLTTLFQELTTKEFAVAVVISSFVSDNGIIKHNGKEVTGKDICNMLGDNSIPKPSSDYCLCPLVCVADPSYSVLIHPNLSGGLEHHVVGLTNQVYSGLFSYPVAES